MGFPVRVMATSETRRACVKLTATLGMSLNRTAVGKEAILSISGYFWVVGVAGVAAALCL